MSSVRDQIRAKTVGAEKKFRNEKVDVDGLEVEVRQPTVGDRGLILDSASSIDEKTKKVVIDLAKLQVNSVLACSFVPGSSEKAFEEADRESLMASPAGGWFDELAKVAQRMINVDTDDAKNA